ncbi:chromosome segregation in meiosis protein 3 [Phlyctema vagabunda]|uniref:Chromosome segregation in meiosis protein n=1 Tax=Phlyctema vagabunda TaxID=108571 RepID=A0ABR4P6H6_9HELO
MSSTTRPLPTGGPSAGGDDLDDLFEYDIGGSNDPFSENYEPSAAPAKQKPDSNKDRDGDDGLGLDAEVEVTKKARVPRVKLDEHRLLSDAGIPKLRKRAKDHLKFKGKGHEFSDAAKLLAFYQLWLDDLFPKARFIDALAMVEKMGHKKMMQTMRMEWINEGKPRPSERESSLFEEPTLPPQEEEQRPGTAPRIAPIFEKPTTQRPTTPDHPPDDEMEDLYDATPRPARQAQPAATEATTSIFGAGNSIFGPQKTPVDDGPPDDDLDALLAEEEIMNTKNVPSAPKPAAPPVDDFDDEMEAMADMDDMW